MRSASPSNPDFRSAIVFLRTKRRAKKLAQELECELPFFSTCDCPEAKGFTCTDGICNWNYV